MAHRKIETLSTVSEMTAVRGRLREWRSPRLLLELGLEPPNDIDVGGRRIRSASGASGAVAAVAPTPGGVGPFEAAAVAAFGAVGVAASFAVTAVITFRLITYWLPVIPGGIALRALRRRGALWRHNPREPVKPDVVAVAQRPNPLTGLEPS
jgi:Lysylphosphatidylglycerol synthase TM region